MHYILTENVCPILLAEVSYKWIKRKQKQLMYGIVVAVHLQLLVQPSFHQRIMKETVNVCTFVIGSLWLHVRVWLCVGFFFPPNMGKWSSSFPFFHGVLLLGNCLYASEFQSADGNGSAQPTHLHLFSGKATVVSWLIIRLFFFFFPLVKKYKKLSGSRLLNVKIHFCGI